jgi:hypothetical protein
MSYLSKAEKASYSTSMQLDSNVQVTVKDKVVTLQENDVVFSLSVDNYYKIWSEVVQTYRRSV